MTAMTTQVFRLPDLGEGLTEAGLVQWLVSVGDTIATDQAVAEVETAKSVVELPSPFAGVVMALHGEPGESIDVGAPVLEVAETPGPDGADAVEHDAYREEERAGSGNVLIGYGTREQIGAGRRRPRGGAIPRSPARPASTPPQSAAVALTSSAAPMLVLDAASDPDEEQHRRTVAVRSPLVRRLARDLGVDVHAITPTGHDGSVTRADVLAAAVDTAVDSPTARIDGLAVSSRERMSPMRKAVSAAMTRSRSEIPEATVWVDVDATELWGLRSQMASPGDRAPSVTALIARFVLMALADHPVLASRLSEDGSELILFDGVNLGVAADTERGLLVPVIPRADALNVEQLDAALRELTTTARSGRMTPERMSGSTFTLNNYGGLGVDGSAAIINHPDVAILGVGRIIERPWVIDGEIVPRRITQLSLVFDHRVCDGGYAAGFLGRLRELLEHPLRAFGRI